MTGNSLFFTVCLVFPLDGLLVFVGVRVATVVLFVFLDRSCVLGCVHGRGRLSCCLSI